MISHKNKPLQLLPTYKQLILFAIDNQSVKFKQMLNEKTSFKNTLAQIYHSYYSDTDVSQISEFTQSKISFFTDFQRKNKMISCRIQNITTVPKQSFHRAYTLYQIDMLTEELYFTTQKRYSEFEKLHRRIKKFKSLELKFPRKTYFQSGTEISVTSERIAMLNEFITSILTLKDQFSDIKFMFFDFVGLWDKYLEKGIDINNSEYEYFMANTQNIFIEILKLNENPKIISTILERIRKLIFDYKIKLSLETARQIFFGLQNDKKGLFAFAFNQENQYVAIQCLQLIFDLLDAEKTKNSQLFLKTLQSSSAKRLSVQQSHLLENLNFKKLYFQVLKLHQSKPSQKDLKAIFVNQSEVYHEYLFWLKGKNRKLSEQQQMANDLICSSSIPTELFNKMQCKRSFQKVKAQIELSSNELSQMDVQSSSKAEYLNENKNCLFFEGASHISFKVKFPKEEKKKIDGIDRKKWQIFQSEIRNKYTDVITKTLTINKERKFKFNENIQKENEGITLEPIHTDHFDDCFFEFSQVVQKEDLIEVIQIIYFCHSNSHQIKDYLKKKLQQFWIQVIQT